MLLYLLLLGGCVNKNIIRSARSAFTDSQCVKTFKTYMRSAECYNVDLVERKYEIIIRCRKPDAEKTNFWEKYWFRITPVALKISDDLMPEIERHTICKDEMHRLEAYPP